METPLQGYKPGQIRTFTGKIINVLDIKKEDICIEDIAHSLTMQCRFGGHTCCHYSVAEHSLAVQQIISKMYYRIPEPQDFRYTPPKNLLELTALLHDASEAYIMDLPSPIKLLMPLYINIEDNIMKTIALKFNTIYPLPQKIHLADKLALKQEWDYIIIQKKWTCTDSKMIEKMFLNMFELLNK